MDDEHPGFRIAVPAGVQAGVGRPVALMVPVRPSCHVLMVDPFVRRIVGTRYGC
jgi:hypothetical protein